MYEVHIMKSKLVIFYHIFFYMSPRTLVDKPSVSERIHYITLHCVQYCFSHRAMKRCEISGMLQYVKRTGCSSAVHGKSLEVNSVRNRMFIS